MWGQPCTLEPELLSLVDIDLFLLAENSSIDGSDGRSSSHVRTVSESSYVSDKLPTPSDEEMLQELGPDDLSDSGSEKQLLDLSLLYDNTETGYVDHHKQLNGHPEESDVDAVLLEMLLDIDTPKQGPLLTSMDLTSESWLPLYEQQEERNPINLQIEHQHTHYVLLQHTPSPYSGEKDFLDERPEQPVSVHRNEEIDIMAHYIKRVIEKGRTMKSEENPSKLKVHEVILVILLNAKHGDRSKDLRRILAFCDKDGHEISEEGEHFKTLDTETMGLLWMKIKGNKNCNYDTFARAMRVRREKSAGYFEYLDPKKLRSKKKIYRFGKKTLSDMSRMKQTLRQMSAPQTFGSEF